MDFMNRGVRTNQTSTHQADGTGTSQNGTGPKAKFGKKGLSLAKIGSVGFMLSLVVLAVAALLLLGLGKGGLNEEKYVEKDKFQAIFLNGGQVYFGKIADLNSQYLKVGNIYYLRVNQQVQPDQSQQAAQNDISLVKLGCELHGPTDEMVINREQVIFWENLKDDGQVAKAVAEYVKQNPNGQDCKTQSGSGTPTSPAASTPAPSPAATPPASTTPAANRNTNTTR